MDQATFLEYLKKPILFPTEFKEWVSDWFSTNVPKIHVSQIFGFKLQSVKSAVPVAGTLTTANTASFVDLGANPLDGLANGFYVVFFGAQSGFATSAVTAMGNYIGPSSVLVGISVDGAAVSDYCSIAGGANGRLVLLDLTSGDNTHSIALRFKSGLGAGTTALFAQPFLHAIKVVTE